MSEPAALAGSEGYEVCSNDVAGMAGLEPAMRESKSLALPLGYTPVSSMGKAPGPEPKLRPSGLFQVGWVKGLEPSTPGTTIRCSNQLSYTHQVCDV